MRTGPVLSRVRMGSTTYRGCPHIFRKQINMYLRMQSVLRGNMLIVSFDREAKSGSM